MKITQKCVTIWKTWNHKRNITKAQKYLKNNTAWKSVKRPWKKHSWTWNQREKREIQKYSILKKRWLKRRHGVQTWTELLTALQNQNKDVAIVSVRSNQFEYVFHEVWQYPPRLSCLIIWSLNSGMSSLCKALVCTEGKTHKNLNFVCVYAWFYYIYFFLRASISVNGISRDHTRSLQ